MELDITISDRMTAKESPLGSIENRLIRIPLKIREALGLSIGAFLCLQGIDNKDVHLQIEHAYVEEAELNKVFVSSEIFHTLDLEKRSRKASTDSFLVGCDPEFFLVDSETGNAMAASHFFPTNGDVGNDCGLVELRPMPSASITELFSNIRNLLIKARNTINQRKLHLNKKIKLIGASNYRGTSAGFHIHFGIPSKLLEKTKVTEALMYRIVGLLDYYVGIPAILSEGQDVDRRSHKTGAYGKPGDFRCKGLTYEYRVAGGNILQHPILTVGLLAISTVVMRDIIARIALATNNFAQIDTLDDYKSLHNIYPNLPDRTKVCDAISSTSDKQALDCLPLLLEDIKKMIDYQEYSIYILKYFEHIDNLINNGIQFSNDLDLNWRITNERQPIQLGVSGTSV